MNAPLVDARYVPVINREEEIREAVQRLDQMLADLPVSECVLHFDGVPMVGKTTLLTGIRREASRKHIASALVDFDRERILKGRATDRIIDNWYDGTVGRIHIIEQILSDLSRTGEFVTGSDISSLAAEPAEAVEKLLVFTRNLYRFNQQRPFLLLFDTIEDIDPETFLWVQDEIVKRFLEFHTLIIIASRVGPNTVNRDLIYPLERRTKKLHLKPFDSAQTDKQVEAIGAKQLPVQSTELNRYTGGLPGLNDAAVRWLVQRKSVEGSELLPYLIDHVIFERLARPVVQEVKAEILAVSPLRQFDSGLLERVIDTLWPSTDGTTGLLRIRPLIMKMQESRLVEPYSDGYGYAVPHDLRILLDAYWRQVKSREHFEVHQIAAQWFAEQVEQGDFVAIADRLYHLAGIGYDLDRRPALAQYLLPDLPQSPAKPESLIHELREALQVLSQKRNRRAFDLVNKISRVIEQPEFSLIVDERTLRELKHTCQMFADQLH
jgi:hypothetical protein